MWRVTQRGMPLRRDQLILPNQKVETISRHLKKTEEAGLIEKRRRIFRYDNTFNAAPNDYILKNPTHKVWIEDESVINDSFSFALQNRMGKQQTDYYNKIYTSTSPTELTVEIVSEMDMETLRRCETIDFLGFSTRSYFNDEAYEHERQLKKSKL